MPSRKPRCSGCLSIERCRDRARSFHRRCARIIRGRFRCSSGPTLAIETLLDGEAEVITRKAIELAKKGDLAAIRLCLDRIAPREKTVLFPSRCPL